MPELSEVENVLVSLVTQVLYPFGTAAESATGHPVRVFRGWPLPAGLDAALKDGVVSASVFPLETEQNATRYTREWMELPSPAPTLTLAVAGENVTVGGSVCCPLNAAVVVNGKPYVHPLQATDTPTSVATALASLISADRAASSNGPVLTVPGATNLEARVGSVGLVVQEVKRQKKGFRITLWCPTPEARDEVAAVLDPALSDLTFVSLTDGTAGRIRYERTHTIDSAQKVGLYRRDFDYSVEYATTNVRKAAEVVGNVVNVTGTTGDLATQST